MFEDLLLIQPISVYIYVLARVSSLLINVPLFSSPILPWKVKIILALSVSVIVANTLKPMVLPHPLSFPGMMLISQQILIGLAISLMFQLLFHISIAAGQMIATQCSLGAMPILDPIHQESLPIMSQIYFILTLWLFLFTNGHIYLITIIHKSFDLFPLLLENQLQPMWLETVLYFGDIFSGALAVAIPSLIILLIVNISIAAMAAPSINAFMSGFPLMLFVGLGIVYLTLPSLILQTEERLLQGYDEISHLLRGVANGQ